MLCLRLVLGNAYAKNAYEIIIIAGILFLHVKFNSLSDAILYDEQSINL